MHLRFSILYFCYQEINKDNVSKTRQGIRKSVFVVDCFSFCDNCISTSAKPVRNGTEISFKDVLITNASDFDSIEKDPIEDFSVCSRCCPKILYPSLQRITTVG